MNYEKEYKKLKADIEKAYLFAQTDSTKSVLEHILPELRESENERTRKEIISFLQLPHKQFVGERKQEKWIAWLEKQELKSNPYSGVSFNYNGNTWGMCARDNGVDILFNKKLIQHISDEKQDEQELPIEKLPEEMKTIGESLGLTTQEECDEYNKMVSDLIMSEDKIEPKFNVGDKIIKFSKTPCPVHTLTDDTICEVVEVQDTCYILNTKEGKIQEPFEWQDYYELVGQKPSWGEEDDYMLESIIFDFAAAHKSSIGQDKWLKSLKDRVQLQPKQEKKL